MKKADTVKVKFVKDNTLIVTIAIVWYFKKRDWIK